MNELEEFRGKYCTWLTTMNFSPATVETRNRLISYFIEWAHERGLYRPREISPAILERYRHNLVNQGQNGRRIKVGTQRARLAAVKEFFKWLSRERHLLYNPAGDLELPRTGSPLPTSILSIKEVETVLQSIELDTPSGIRDRAMFEVFYSCGIRRKEICNLKLNDLDMDRGLLMVRHGKGDKDRLIPIGERALLWVEKYLQEARDCFLVAPDDDGLFLTVKGPMKPNYMTILGHRYMIKSGLEKKGSCHVYRHTMATLMLEGGADIRHVQEMLGHASLMSTQIYTRVAVKRLKDVHSTTHPGAKLDRVMRR